MRPLDPMRSIKAKLGVVIAVAVVATMVVNEIGLAMNVVPVTRGLVSFAIGLLMVQLLARGMTSPLREMAAAAAAMAHGDYSRRVRATSRDEVGHLATAFNTMAADLAEVDRLRRDLVANVSHELRTPISALHAVLENVADGVQPPDQDTVATMLGQVQRLGRLVDQLLDLSRLESGAVPLERADVDLPRFLNGAADEARLHAEVRGVQVRVSPGDPQVVHVDAERLHQVVANLIDNAVRHSPRGSDVVLSGERRGDGVRITVSDDGPGIAAADAQRVFERFYRSDSARSAADGGSGLGLAIARWVIDLHGGSIAIDPTTSSGCRVVVDLPGAHAR
jgi:signal transduction histidine kinase